MFRAETALGIVAATAAPAPGSLLEGLLEGAWRMEIDDSGMAGAVSSSVVPGFGVSTRVLDKTALVAVRGELDMATGPLLSDSVHDHAGNYERVIFDLSALSFIDVAGFRALLECADEVRVMTIRSPSPAVRRLLEILERESLIEDETEARPGALAPD